MEFETADALGAEMRGEKLAIEARKERIKSQHAESNNDNKEKKRSNVLTEAGKKARAAYQRNWRKKNAEKAHNAVVNYWNRKAESNAMQTPENTQTELAEEMRKAGINRKV